MVPFEGNIEVNCWIFVEIGWEVKMRIVGFVSWLQKNQKQGKFTKNFKKKYINFPKTKGKTSITR